MSQSPHNDPHEIPADIIDAVPTVASENTAAFPDYFSALPPEIQAEEKRGKRSKLYNVMRYAPDVYARVLKYIEMGAYGHVVAEAMGIKYETWMGWLRKGEKAKPGTYYHKFISDVRRAESKARIITEIQVRRDNPEFWLKNGPGKSTKRRPEGWTEINTEESLTNIIGHGHKEDVTNADLAETLRAAQELGLVNLLLSPPLSDEDEDDDE